MPSAKIGVVLFQLGGPDSLQAIEPFLYNLFCDPDIIDFPFARLARHPLAGAAISELEGFAPDELVLLPLYPQFSKTTTQSSVNEWNRRFHANGWNPRVHLVREFHQVHGYIQSVVRAIDSCLADQPHTPDLDMVFSAHSVPVAVIEAGDPYQRQIEQTVD